MLYTHSLHVNKEECFSNACFSFDAALRLSGKKQYLFHLSMIHMFRFIFAGTPFACIEQSL